MLGSLQERIRAKIVPLGAAAQYLTGGAALLEVGSGEGLFLEHVVPRYRQVLGIDIDERKLSRARRRFRAAPHVEIREADALSFLEQAADGQFDAVVLVDTLSSFTLADQTRLLRECARVLAPAGVLLLKFIDGGVPVKSFLSTLLSTAIYRGLRLSISDGQRFRYRTSEDLLGVLSGLGLCCALHPLHQEPFHPIPHVLLLARKQPADGVRP